MEPFRIILADDEPITRMDIKEMLEEEDFLVVGECGDGLTAVNLAKAVKPELVILDVKMPGMNGIEAARLLTEEHVAPVLLLTAYSNVEMIIQAQEVGVLAYLVKPVTKSNLIAAVRIAISRYKEFDVLRNEIAGLNEALRTRKLVERAKGLLQKKYLMSEEQAFKKIRMISMKQQKSMGEVAEAIIVSLGST
ncbi:MAG: ANTAR domain-containing response regulator [Eubacteriales bacterium]